MEILKTFLVECPFCGEKCHFLGKNTEVTKVFRCPTCDALMEFYCEVISEPKIYKEKRN